MTKICDEREVLKVAHAPYKVITAVPFDVESCTKLKGLVHLDDGSEVELLIIYSRGTLSVLLDNRTHLYLQLSDNNSNHISLELLFELTKMKLDWSKYTLIDGKMSSKYSLKVEEEKTRKFPVATTPRSDAFIFWEMIEPHRKQALRNHGQSLERLAERGGCCPEELCAILEDREYRKMDKVEARDRLADLTSNFIIMQNMTATIPGMNIYDITTDNDPNTSDHEIKHFRLDGSEIK